ncbi:hypothetical protein ACJX0J_035799, partial [Zea mays]
NMLTHAIMSPEVYAPCFNLLIRKTNLNSDNPAYRSKTIGWDHPIHISGDMTIQVVCLINQNCCHEWGVMDSKHTGNIYEVAYFKHERCLLTMIMVLMLLDAFFSDGSAVAEVICLPIDENIHDALVNKTMYLLYIYTTCIGTY